MKRNIPRSEKVAGVRSYKTISLKMHPEVMETVRLRADGNMSHLIEEVVSQKIDKLKTKIPTRRPNGPALVKKTFTLSPDLVVKIKKHGNMNFTIESILIDHFKIKLSE